MNIETGKWSLMFNLPITSDMQNWIATEAQGDVKIELDTIHFNNLTDAFSFRLKFDEYIRIDN